MSHQHKSISTVVEAYRLLEDQGVLEAHPQSGYYVRTRLAHPLPARSSPPPTSPTDVRIGELVIKMLTASSEPSSCSWPSPYCLPSICLCGSMRQLKRIISAIARRDGGRTLQYDFLTAMRSCGCRSRAAPLTRAATLAR